MSIATLWSVLPVVYLVLQVFAVLRLPRDWTVTIWGPLVAMAAGALILTAFQVLGLPGGHLAFVSIMPPAILCLLGAVAIWAMTRRLDFA